ncbi:hypothetical protein [Nocardia asteroides]|uniref:hypothetical protein n=1 Tax=Nocardia asteroides TaxID=1824 RepID=UPI0033D8FD7D
MPNPPGLVVDASYLWTAFMLALVKPKIFVNGQRVPDTRWGRNHVPVGPGQYHVRVVTPWLFDMGPAETVVPVGAGPGSTVYYRSPAVFFLNGAIGDGPQKTPGLVLALLPGAVALVLFLLTFLAILFG